MKHYLLLGKYEDLKTWIHISYVFNEHESYLSWE